MDQDEIIVVETLTVACDGGGGALGHPKVFLTFDETGVIVCPYCSRTYHLKKGADAHAH